MSISALPRKQIMSFAKLCQSNLMYFLFRSYYTSVGWGQRALYNAIKVIIDPETKLKLVLSGERAPAELIEAFHPSQLEQRFGGAMPTPTNFWPPYMGTTFCTDQEKAELHTYIEHENYDKTLERNPELFVHPMDMRPDRCNNWHFKLPEPEVEAAAVVNEAENELNEDEIAGID